MTDVLNGSQVVADRISNGPSLMMGRVARCRSGDLGERPRRDPRWTYGGTRELDIGPHRHTRRTRSMTIDGRAMVRMDM